MSSSIVIPTTPSAGAAKYNESPKSGTGSSASSYTASPSPGADMPASPSSPSSSSMKPKMLHERRPSLLSSAILKQETTVINIGDPEGTPRLISYLSSSQGFAWNPEIFLPSYVDCDYVPLENRRDPVHEITVTDEEVKNLLPQ